MEHRPTWLHIFEAEPTQNWKKKSTWLKTPKAKGGKQSFLYQKRESEIPSMIKDF